MGNAKDVALPVLGGGGIGGVVWGVVRWLTRPR